MTDLEAGNAVPSGEETVKQPYRAPFHKVPVQEIRTDIVGVFRRFVPEGFDLGDEMGVAGDIRIRQVALPNDPEKLKIRIAEIQAAGTDRTDPNFVTPYDRRVYIPAARRFNLNPMDLFDTDTPRVLYNNADEIEVARSTDTDETPHYTSSNGILVYDAKTETGIKRVEAAEYTFKDLDRRNEALLAIIKIESDAGS